MRSSQSRATTLLPAKLIIYFCVTGVLFLQDAQISFGQNPIYIVSPGELELAEGNRAVAGGQGGGQYQGLYYAEDFLSLPDTHRVITGLAWRPDGNNSFSSPITCPVRFSLSTTNVDGLSNTFSDNIGDDATVVFDGTLIWQDKSSGSSPRDFDFYVPLDVPFAYDPSEGNLLLTFAAPMDCDHVGTWFLDERELFTGNITAVAGGVSSTTASIAHRTIFVAQFEFVPEPSSASLVLVTGFLCFLALRPTRGSHVHCAIAGE